MLVTFKQIIGLAEAKNFCVPAFNVYNMETVMGVFNAAEAANAPVIMQIYPRLFNEGSGDFLAPIILTAARKASVPVCLHLDHGPSEREVLSALRAGATGIMYDGSALPFEENIATTRRMVDLCAHVGVAVEGELGHIGTVNDDTMDELTVPEDAARFVKETGVTALAVLIGNAHGRYKKPPCLDIDRVAAIRKLTGISLVLHGGSGIPDDQVRAAIAAGVRKMNIGTDLCYSFLDQVGEDIKDPKHPIGIDTFMKGAVASVRDFAATKIELLGAGGKGVL